jgi:single-stranded-DNA-specific exonuclease
LPSDRIAELQAQLDAYARAQLTLTDFEQVINIDAELALDSITPDLFDALRMLEPFGAGNPEPVFSAIAARLVGPPKILKEKHVRLKLAPGGDIGAGNGWRRSLTHKAVGWRLAERVALDKLLHGDLLDIVFTLDHNDHPEFGGVELSLRDFRAAARVGAVGTSA